MTLPILPDTRTAIKSVKEWAATDAKFAGLLASSESSAGALARWSLELLAADRVDEAIAAIRAALALKPKDAVIWSNFGAALNQANQSAESITTLEHSLNLLPHQPDTWLLLGMVRKASGDAAGAEEAYHQALEFEPRSIAAWQLLGLLKEEQRDFPMALDCLKACIDVAGPTAALHAYVGKLSYHLGRFAEASDAYTLAAGLDPANALFQIMARKCAFIRAMIQGEPVETALANFDGSLPPWIKIDSQEREDLFKTAFSQLSGFGYPEAAAKVGRKQLELWPENNSVKYLLAAVTGDTALDRAPCEYVVEEFDSFAEVFEEQLVAKLGYAIPAELCTAVRASTETGKLYDALDAGCGTGLCGPLLKPLSRRLDGVDLSPKMLEQARLKGVYDTLVCEELVEYLERSPGQYDLIVLADTMIYFGDLKPLIAGIVKALRPGGLLAFSIESCNAERYQIQPSGRFGHSPDYVESILSEKFEQLVCTETTIRFEAVRRLAGNVFVFRRR